MKSVFFLAFTLGSSQTLLADTTKEDSREPSLLESAKEKANEIMKSDSMQKARESWEKSKEISQEGWEKGQEIHQKVVGPRTSRDNRRDSVFSLFYEPLASGLWIPQKSGYLAAWVLNENWAMEVEYLSGSLGIGMSGIDLVDFSERLVLARARWTVGSSFNMGFGLGQRSYRFSLGNDYVAKVSDYNVAALPSLKVENQVVTFAIGNRWQFDNGITIGADWVEVVATVGQGKVDDGITMHFTDANARDNTRDVLSALRYGPTVTAVKLQMGYTF